MKNAIHPKFNVDTKVTCLCGKVFATGSILTEINVEICSNCHPIYTGEKRMIDTLGRVDRFMLAQKKAATKQSTAKKGKSDPNKSSLPAQQSLKDMLAEAKTAA